MSLWEVVYTEQAENDLRHVYEYIAFSLLEPAIANRQTRRIINAIAGLGQMPLRFQRLEIEPWHSRGLRVMPINNYLVFFLPVTSRKIVIVIRIMYSKRDIGAQLAQGEQT